MKTVSMRNEESSNSLRIGSIRSLFLNYIPVATFGPCPHSHMEFDVYMRRICTNPFFLSDNIYASIYIRKYSLGCGTVTLAESSLAQSQFKESFRALLYNGAAIERGVESLSVE